LRNWREHVKRASRSISLIERSCARRFPLSEICICPRNVSAAGEVAEKRRNDKDTKILTEVHEIVKVAIESCTVSRFIAPFGTRVNIIG